MTDTTAERRPPLAGTPEAERATHVRITVRPRPGQPANTVDCYRAPAVETIGWLKGRGYVVTNITRGRIVLSGPDGPAEAWKLGPWWIIGQPDDVLSVMARGGA